MRLILLAAMLTLSLQVICQEQYHYLLGSEELSGLDVYGINQGDDGDYWIATNRGLYHFDGYNFKRLEHKDQKSSSLFNPKFDYSGRVYCSNLSGQIFSVKEGKLHLEHVIPDSILGPYMSYDFLENNQMIVASKDCYRFTEDGIEIILNVGATGASASFARKPNGNLLIHSSTDSITEISISSHQTNWMPMNSKGVISLVHNSDTWYLNESDRAIYQIDSLGSEVKLKLIYQSNQSGRIYFTSTSFWFANNTYAAFEFGPNQPADPKPKFENYFISHVFEDREGNILLGTFGSGIIVVPKTEMTLIQPPVANKISKITSNGNSGLFLGSTNGEVFEWTDAGYEKLISSSTKQIELLEYLPSFGKLILDRNSLSILDVASRTLDQYFIGSVKDMAIIDEFMFAVGTHARVFKLNVTDPQRQNVGIETGRTSSLAFDPIKNELVVATTTGLVRIDSLNAINRTFFNQGNFLVNDLSYHAGSILVATQKFGIIKLKGDSLHQAINESNGLLTNNVRQIISLNDTLYVSTEAGFQVFDQSLENLAILGGSDGLKGKKVIDFEVDNSYVWFLDQTGLKRLSKSFFKRQNVELPKIKSVDLIVNGDLFDATKNNISYKENEVELLIQAPTLSKMDDISYRYRLNDDSWEEGPYLSNSIIYRSLPFGNHEFEVSLNYKGREIDFKSVSFRVSTPYYFTWWFISGCGLLFLMATFLIYQNRLKAVAHNSRQIAELNASKLSALQSQMNPHFIFNALNSIQEYIMLNERKLAGKYLGKFADLMRMYLNYSQTKSITLKEEIDALELYLDLEKLRFEDILTYSISVDDKVDLNCMIPALLIQPYVENALKHGLLHKPSDRKLHIDFQYNEDHNMIECHVVDNGVGREKSHEINKIRNPSHQSFASGATQNRLKLLNHAAKIPIGEETIDLFHDDGSSAGTKVIISIPIISFD